MLNQQKKIVWYVHRYSIAFIAYNAIISTNETNPRAAVKDLFKFPSLACIYVIGIHSLRHYCRLSLGLRPFYPTYRWGRKRQSSQCLGIAAGKIITTPEEERYFFRIFNMHLNASVLVMLWIVEGLFGHFNIRHIYETSRGLSHSALGSHPGGSEACCISVCVH